MFIKKASVGWNPRRLHCCNVAVLGWAAGRRAAGCLDSGASGGCLFTFAAGQGFFKTGAAAGFADNAVKLHLAVKTLEHTLETLVVLGSNFGQKYHPFPSELPRVNVYSGLSNYLCQVTKDWMLYLCDIDSKRNKKGGKT